MGTEHIPNKQLRAISLNKKEIANVISLLTAQLAGTSGAVPSIDILDKGVVKYRLVLYLEDVLYLEGIIENED